MKTLKKLLLPLFTILLLIPCYVHAQVDISVSARVLESLVVTAVNDLEFGDIVAGNTSAVAPDDATAGQYEISGEAGSEVSLSFTLPSNLELVLDPSFTMPISFSNSDGIHSTTNDAGAGSTFDPNVVHTPTLNAMNGDLYIFIGGEVTAAPGQEPGNYEGTITLTVEYTGN